MRKKAAIIVLLLALACMSVFSFVACDKVDTLPSDGGGTQTVQPETPPSGGSTDTDDGKQDADDNTDSNDDEQNWTGFYSVLWQKR